MSDCFASTVDFLSLTVKPQDFAPNGEELYQPDAMPVHEFFDYLLVTLEQCRMISPSVVQNPAGKQNYAFSFSLKRPSLSGKSVNAGLLAYTPEGYKGNLGFYFSLSGDGCYGVDFYRFFKALKPFPIRITRVDLALDYYHGELSYQQVKDLYHAGSFNPERGRIPRFSTIEPKTPTEKVGQYTIYIGKRGNSKFVRAYEKALQTDETSPFPRWLRLEFEIRNKDFDIPLDFIEDKDAFLLSLYPRLIPVIPTPNHATDSDFTKNLYKNVCKTPESQVSIEHLLHYARLSYGGLVNVLFYQLEYTPEEIVKALLPDDPNKVPNRLIKPILSCDVVENDINTLYEQHLSISKRKSERNDVSLSLSQEERQEKYAFFVFLMHEYMGKMFSNRRNMGVLATDEDLNINYSKVNDDYRYYLSVVFESFSEIQKLYPNFKP